MIGSPKISRVISFLGSSESALKNHIRFSYKNMFTVNATKK